jgi:hypothetical protein
MMTTLDPCRLPSDLPLVPARVAQPETSRLVRQRVEAGGERLWRLRDFQGLPGTAVAQALSRLARKHVLRRVTRGVYFRPRPTVFGESLPDPTALQEMAAARAPVFPAGLAAANLLGFSTQSARRAEVATTANSLPRKLVGDETVVHSRRPAAWSRLEREDAGLLDFLRHAGRTSELSPEATTSRTLELLAEGERYARLASAAPTEPPRVRALLGALGEALGVEQAALARLRRSLNPLSRFDFGAFAGLSTAKTWQAKARASP